MNINAGRFEKKRPVFILLPSMNVALENDRR
jgi:hypothetical protein